MRVMSGARNPIERKKIDETFRSRELQGIRGVHLKVFERMEEVYLNKLAKYSLALIEKLKNDAKESQEGALAAPRGGGLMIRSPPT